MEPEKNIEIINTVLKTMKSKGWKDVPLETISAKKNRGAYMISTTYPNTNPSIVIYKEFDVNNPHVIREQIVFGLFEKEGLTPKIFAKENGFYIQECWGEAFDENCVEFGKIMATIHKFSYEWYDKLNIRQKVIEIFPGLKEAPLNSGLWSLCTRSDHKHLTQEQFKKMLSLMPEPFSKAGKRIVTVHGDLYYGNIIINKERVPKIIDFDFTCASNAAQDLTHVMLYEDRFAIAKSYFTEMGYPLDDEEIELFILDGLVAQFVNFRILRTVLWGEIKPDEGIKRLENLNFVIGEIVKCKKLRTKIVNEYSETVEEHQKDLWPWWNKERVQKEIKDLN